MSGKRKKAIILAPFWGQAGNVGNNRIERFVRWLAEDNYQVIVVQAGSADDEKQMPWGREITVRDPLGLYQNSPPGESSSVLRRKPSRLRRTLAFWIFNPDPSVVWARQAAKHSEVLQAAEGAAFILSSSPPESAHLGAWILSRTTGVPHIVDMRDGWLDDPLKPMLRYSSLRRFREGRIESKILRDAQAVLVTSDRWKELLIGRYPMLSIKTAVVTNAYPPRLALTAKSSVNDKSERVLIHSGRFSGSDPRRTPSILLQPLLRNLSVQPEKGVIQLIGTLTADELEAVEALEEHYLNIGWRIECSGQIPRARLLEQLQEADGLLVLSTSFAGLPAKLFEYIPTEKPLFVVTPKGSATWEVASRLPQVTLAEPLPMKPSSAEQGCFYLNHRCAVPEEFSEQSVSKCFKASLAQ